MAGPHTERAAEGRAEFHSIPSDGTGDRLRLACCWDTGKGGCGSTGKGRVLPGERQPGVLGRSSGQLPAPSHAVGQHWERGSAAPASFLCAPGQHGAGYFVLLPITKFEDL